MSRKYAHKIPFIVKINHNELLSIPNRYDQMLFGTVKNAWDMGAVAVGATIYQVLNCYSGRVGLINSGGEGLGESDLKEAVITAVINKRAGGMGLILGRKAFQRPFTEGVEMLHAIQDVYLDNAVTIAQKGLKTGIY